MSADTAAGNAEFVVREQFLDLICADVELLRAEFDRIIAAEWPQRPDWPCRRAADRDWVPVIPPAHGWRPASPSLDPGEPERPEAWRRQRSPPA